MLLKEIVVLLLKLLLKQVLYLAQVLKKVFHRLLRLPIRLYRLEDLLDRMQILHLETSLLRIYFQARVGTRFFRTQDRIPNRARINQGAAFSQKIDDNYLKNQSKERRWWASSAKKFELWSDLRAAMKPIISFASGSVRPLW